MAEPGRDGIERGTEPAHGIRILSLDGGGIRGLSTLLILKYLMQSINAENPPKLCDIFDLIGGTSTGGLIAIMLGRLQMSVDQAIDSYLGFAPKVFKPKHSTNFIANAINMSKAKGRCDSKALAEAIKNTTSSQLGPGSENAKMLDVNCRCRSFVCAIRREKRSLICFRSYPVEGALDLQPLVWEAARATSAATTFFDPVQIGKFGQEFVDGGGGYNNPVQVAVNEATKIWGGEDQRPIHLLVSIGTGTPAMKGFGSNLKEVAKTLVSIATETDDTWIKFVAAHPQYPSEGDRQCAFRFQVEHGMEHIGLAEHEKIRDIASATQHYMEDEGHAGTKNLQQFKKIFHETNRIKVRYGEDDLARSSVKLEYEDEKLSQIKQCARLLDAKKLATERPTSSYKLSTHNTSISLPNKLFWCSSELEIIQQPKDDARDTPLWPWVLIQYNGEERANDCRQRIKASEADWCPTHGGSFASEIDLTEVWRLMVSMRGFVYSGDIVDQGFNFNIGVIRIVIAGTLNNKPLISFDEVRHVAKLDSDAHGPQIPSTELAAGICRDQGLRPSMCCSGDGPLFSSSQPGWEYVPMPDALAFIVVADGHRCYLRAQVSLALKKVLQMLQICEYLWDHADAIDCDDNDVPIKLRYETFRSSFRGCSDDEGFYLSASNMGFATALRALACERLEGMRLPNEPVVEIQDALRLLQQAEQYDHADRAFTDEAGSNKIVGDWAVFGAIRARFVALAMTTTLCMNLSDCSTLPPEFESLVQHPSGKCYII